MALDRGDSDAEFEAFFRSEFNRVWRLVRRIAPDVQAAEDVAAEAFARAYADWSRVRTLEHRLSWVLRVAGNVAVDAARAETRGVRASSGPAGAPQAERVRADDAIAVREALVAALRHLPRRQREAIVLRYLGDLTVEEVAYSMGMAAATVKTHLHRGVRRLRKAMGSDWDRGEMGYGA
jgi:RNA polymerase sigma-70 factor (sigma-E family)